MEDERLPESLNFLDKFSVLFCITVYSNERAVLSFYSLLRIFYSFHGFLVVKLPYLKDVKHSVLLCKQAI